MREQIATIAMGDLFGGWKIVLVLEYQTIQVCGSNIISHWNRHYRGYSDVGDLKLVMVGCW